MQLVLVVEHISSNCQNSILDVKAPQKHLTSQNAQCACAILCTCWEDLTMDQIVYFQGFLDVETHESFKLGFLFHRNKFESTCM
jgi:hypothetical protein